jgi:hypothetical protein
MIVDQLFTPKIIKDGQVYDAGLNESLADEFMAMAKAKGMNARIAGTPDQERARTDAMLKQRAIDRANAPAPEPVSAEERERLQSKLKELEAQFDPNYEYSDDHSFWTRQRNLAQNINSIRKQLSRGLDESQQLDEIDWKAIQKKANQIGKGAQKFTKNVSQTGDAVAGAANAIGGAGKELGKQLIARPVGATYNAVKGGLGNVADVAKGTYGDVKKGAQAVGQATDTVAKDVGDAGTWAGDKIKQAGRGVANVAGGVGGGIGAVAGGATTGLGRAAAHGFNTGVQNVGGDAVDRLQTNIMTPKSDPVEIKKQIDLKKQEIADLEAKLKTAKTAPLPAQRQAYAGVNPATDRPWTADELLARTQPAQAQAAAPAPATATPTPAVGMPNKISYGPGFGKPAAPKPAAPKPAAPNYGRQMPGYTASLPAGGGGGVLDQKTRDYINRINASQPASLAETKRLERIANALSKPVSKMLQMVESKEDVQRIKQFVDQTFAKYGAVNENAFGVRNIIVEHVTQVGAQRRREFARKG